METENFIWSFLFVSCIILKITFPSLTLKSSLSLETKTSLNYKFHLKVHMELWFDLEYFWEKRYLCGIAYSKSYAKVLWSLE